MRPIVRAAPTSIATLPPLAVTSWASSGSTLPVVGSTPVWVMATFPDEFETLPAIDLVFVRSVADFVELKTTLLVVSRPGVAVAPMPPSEAVNVMDSASGVRLIAPGSRVPTAASIKRSPADAVSEIVLVRVELKSPTATSPVIVSDGAETVIEPSLVVAPSSVRELLEVRLRFPFPVRLTLSLLNCVVTAASGDSSAVQLSRVALMVATLVMIAVPVA